MTSRAEGSAGIAGFMAGSIFLLSMIPLEAGQGAFPPSPTGLLVAAAGIPALLFALGAAATSGSGRRELAAILDAVALWAACALAVTCAAVAVAATAESLSLENIVLAQRNTAPYIVKQPLAAWIYVVACALALQEPALRVVLGPPSRWRDVAIGLVVIALSALGATLFLGGFGGGYVVGLVWVAIKTVVVAFAVLALRAWAGRMSGGVRMNIAWAAALAGLVNLVPTFVQAIR